MDQKVVVTDDRFGSYEEERAVLFPHGIALSVLDLAAGDPLPQSMLDADGILCNLFPMTRDVLERLTRCSVIARYGTGFDNIDVKAAAARGIRVANVPDYAVDEVAEHALALLFAAVRHIVDMHRVMRDGGWDMPHRSGIVRIRGKILGIVGYGRIGSAFHKKTAGFGLSDVLVYDPYVDEAVIAKNGGKKTELDFLLAHADFISVHLPYAPGTKQLIDATALGSLKDGAVIINTSRGGVIDTGALVNELKRRPSITAGLDVFETEPLPPDDRLRGLHNVVLSPHAAYFSRESITELKTRAAMNVREVLLGRKPFSPVDGL